MASNKDLNRLKVILAEKRSLISGYPGSWDVHQLLCLSGVPTRHNLRWNR